MLRFYVTVTLFKRGGSNIGWLVRIYFDECLEIFCLIVLRDQVFHMVRKIFELVPPGGYWKDIDPAIAKEYMKSCWKLKLMVGESGL